MKNLQTVDWTTIPAPQDDGATDHLSGATLPGVSLMSTDGQQVDLSHLPGRTLVYIYPMTGRPDTDLPDGWDSIPGARGCTPQSCSFRDHAEELAALGVNNLYGLSTQQTDYQQEAAERLHLPFPLLSDNRLALAEKLGLPCMEVEGMTLLKRVTLIIDDGVIVKVFYPVFPPDADADRVMDWLKND